MLDFEERTETNKKLIYECIRGIESTVSENHKIVNSKKYALGNVGVETIDLIKRFEIGSLFRIGCEYFRGGQHFLSTEEDVTEDVDSYFTDKRIAVYMVLFGDYDEIKEPNIVPDNVDYYLITDKNIPEGSSWKKKSYEDVIPDGLNNIEKNRFFKLHPDILFPEYEYSVYIDSNVRLMSDVTPFANKLVNFPVAMFLHERRTCVYEEIETCIRQKKDNVDSLKKHRDYLISNGVPKNYGLLAATIIARRHNDPVCKQLMSEWWAEFMSWSNRDQIALIDCLWRNKISVDTIGTLGKNLFMSNLLIMNAHKGELPGKKRC